MDCVTGVCATKMWHDPFHTLGTLLSTISWVLPLVGCMTPWVLWLKYDTTYHPMQWCFGWFFITFQQWDLWHEDVHWNVTPPVMHNMKLFCSMFWVQHQNVACPVPLVLHHFLRVFKGWMYVMHVWHNLLYYTIGTLHNIISQHWLVLHESDLT